MSSQRSDGEIKRPIPRRLFSRTEDVVPIPWIESREKFTSSPVQQDAPPTTHKDLRKALPFITSSNSARSTSPDPGHNAKTRWDSVRRHVLIAGRQSGSGSRSGTPTSSIAPLSPPPILTTSYNHYQQPSSASSSSSFPRPPSRAQTPKSGSRLAARLGFKHVVDHAREAAVDENRKLADDVFNACWATRFGDGSSGGGGGKTKHGDTMNTLNTMFTGASSMHLPFAKSTTGVGSSSAVNVSTSGFNFKKSEHRYSGGGDPYGLHQPSTSAFSASTPLASAPTSAYNLPSPVNFATNRNATSIKYLHQVLWQTSGSSSTSLRSVYLPHETLVLSTLLMPFTSPSNNAGNDVITAGSLEEERWLAIDAFELLIKTWPPASELASAERCLWCTKATTPLPASPLRSRILSTLWGLTNPSENTHVFLSPDTIHSIACGVFMIFALISFPIPTSPASQSQYQNINRPQAENGDSPDVKILTEVLLHLATGVLDEEACEDEYGGTKWNTREDNADTIRKMMLSEALAKCITFAEKRVARWLITRCTEDFWVKLGDKSTALQTAISIRRIAHLCTGIISNLSLLSLHGFPSEPGHDTTIVDQHIIRLLDSIIIPEIQAVSSTLNQLHDGQEANARETRISAARIALDLLCHGSSTIDETSLVGLAGSGNTNPSRWAVGVVTRWYTNPTQEGGKWRESFEEMFKTLIINAEWSMVVDRLAGFVNRMVVPGDSMNVRKKVVGIVFPYLTDRLVQDPPPPYLLAPTASTKHARTFSDQSQTDMYSLSHSRSSSYAFSSILSPTSTTTLPVLLKLISDIFPQTFFKPLFLLAAAGSTNSTSTTGITAISSNIGIGTIALTNTLCVVHVLSAIVKDWWVRDAEMVCVALMTSVDEPKGKGKGKARENSRDDVGFVGGEGRLGQLVVLLELAGKLRALRRLKDSRGKGGRNESTGLIAAALGSDTTRDNLSKFVVGLELRLSLLIEAKEKLQPTPLTQRLLFLMLFRELRLITRSLKPAPWVPTMIRWLEEYLQDEDAQAEEIGKRIQELREIYEFAKGAASNSNKRRTVVMMSMAAVGDNGTGTETGEFLDVPGMLHNTIKLLSSLAKGFLPRAVKLIVTISAMLNPDTWARISPLVWYQCLLPDKSHDAYSGDGESHREGGKKTKSMVPLVCFLVMQCAEKDSMGFRAMVEVDMQSSDDLTRLESVHKLSLLINWRFQLMSESHNILVDRTHRPFRLARAPLPFVPTDIGSPTYVRHEDDASLVYLSIPTSRHNGGNTVIPQRRNMKKDVIPAELRKQLVEIGWADDDVQGNEKEMWIRTPVSLLPVNQVERLDLQRAEPQHHRDHQDSVSIPNSPVSGSPTSSGGQATPLIITSGGKGEGTGDGELLRRNSSSGGPTHAKRRAVFVPSLSLTFRVLATMVFDSNFAVASAARDTLLDLMRNDPGLLLRPILDMFCDEQGQGQEDYMTKDVPQAVNILSALIHTRHFIPPPMAHAIFNNLAGFLKYVLRQADSSSAPKSGGRFENKESLTNFALMVPIMAKIAAYVGDLTIREIKRSKMEHFLIPYGTLWFDHAGVPSGPMFPRGLMLDFSANERDKDQRGITNPFESELSRRSATEISGPDLRLVNVMMIRIAQNMMFVGMLKRSAQDVVLVRKTMPKFIIPRLDGRKREEDGRLLELGDFVPFSKNEQGFSEESAKKTLRVLSLALARSYVALVAQVFRCMSRNSNDRQEMANFVDGLNRILLIHGDDLGIVGHVLTALMVASARFRRLFTSGGGYALFMPALAKVYTESYQRLEIRLAIEYAVYRFYALHHEAFLFQSLNVIAHVAALPVTDAAQYATRMYDLFYSLRNGVAPTNLDPAGIHGINQAQEREALLFRAAEDKPQTFLTAIRRGEGQNNGQIFFEIPDAYETSRLRMEDFVKLFLTIIAHDPSILRAQYFMRLFRFLVPRLYDASSQARNVLQEGLFALSEILLKNFTKSKTAEGGNTAHVGEVDVVPANTPTAQEAADKDKGMSNISAMRLDFLFALIAVGKAGCHIPTQMAKQAIEIAKLILKDNPTEMLHSLSSFFADLAQLIFLRGDLSKPKYVIPFMQEISPFIRAYTTILDFTSTFETITRVCSIQPYSHYPVFTKLAVHELCVAGLDACELITSEAESSHTRFRAALVPLLAEAVLLRGSDVLGELEKRKPTFRFLAKVVLPLALTLKTSNQLAVESGKLEAWHRPALTKAWIRLLFYAMTACQRSFRTAEHLPLFRSKSRQKRSTDEQQWETHLPTFATAMQVIKVVVIRAETEISSTLPDLWQRLASFLKSALVDGNANFALHDTGAGEPSPLSSPTPSPRKRAQPETSTHSPSFFDLPGQSMMDMRPTASVPQPRVIDYALWSLLEFLCAFRSPLRLQLRLFTVEKVVALDQELKSRQRRHSPSASPNMTPMSRRTSTFVFAKPRRSGMFPSPDSSPRASRSPSIIHELSIPSIHLEIPTSTSGGELRIPGYQHTSPTMSPSTPRQGTTPYLQVEDQGPRIVHLGPTSPSALIPPSPLSPSVGGSMGVSNIRLMGQSTKIKSSALAKATYRRIRTVQTFMGYDTLLPLPTANVVGLGITGLEMGSDEVSLMSWTKRSALEAVLNEMRQLEEEFEEAINQQAWNDQEGRERK